MKAKILISVLLIFFVSGKSFSQYVQEWNARYNGLNNYYDRATSLVVDNSGNVYVTGDSERKFLTIKYNSSGKEMWTARYLSHFNSADISHAIAVDNLRNVYVTGEASASAPGFYHDYTTIKYDMNGNQLWVKIYNSVHNNHDRAKAMALDKNGNVIVTGNSVTYDTIGNFSYNTIKYDPDGNQLWISRYYGFTSYVLGGVPPQVALAIDSSNNIIIAGLNEVPYFDFENIVIKYGSNGIQSWIKKLRSGSDRFTVGTDKSDNVYFANGNVLIKYNSSGDSLWSSPHMITYIKKIAVDNSGNVYAAGSAYFGGFVTVKYDSIGNHMWTSVDSIGVYLNAMIIDNDGNIFETGYRGISGRYDYYTVKYNTNGIKIWNSQHNGPADSTDIANDMKIDNSGSIYITGFSRGSGTNYDYATIKYSIVTNSNNFSSAAPNSFKLYQNYPNPFNPATKINFDIPQDVKGQTSNVKLIIYDALGKELTSLVNQELSPGSYEAEFDGSNFSSGIYYYKLILDSFGEAVSFSEVKKMILLK